MEYTEDKKNADHIHFRRAYQRTEEIVNGPGSSGRYRAVWHRLKLGGCPVKLITDVETGNGLALLYNDFSEKIWTLINIFHELTSIIIHIEK